MSDFGVRFIYRKIFENDILRSSGDSFQQIVYNLFQNIYEHFERIDSQGAIGDRKNDGYIRGKGIFYQVYGPKDVNINNTSLTTAITKMPGDFYLLKKHIEEGKWEPIKKYIFVFKVHRGTYPDVIEELNKLQKDNPDIEFEICDINNLIILFDSLDINKMSIVTNNHVPTPDFTMVNYEVMGEIIEYLVSQGASENIDLTKTPPDFEEKIVFNKISPYHASNLRIASYKIDQLDDYLSSYSDNKISDYLCDIFKRLYSKSKDLYKDNSVLQFQYILNSCHKPNTPKAQLQLIESNSYIIMAKYFETCDIFEEPKK